MIHQYDVVVVGGGLAGSLIALRCAQRELRTLLTDPRGCLGWEVTRAGRLFAHATADTVPVLEEMSAFGAYKNGIFYPPGLEVFFEQRLLAAGGEILYHLWPLACYGDDRGAEVVFASKHGKVRFSARTVVDCTRQGILVQQIASRGETSPAVREVRHGLLLGGVQLQETLLLSGGDLFSPIAGLCLRPTGQPGIVHGDLSLGVEEGEQVEAAVCHSLIPLRQHLRKDPRFQDVVVVHVYEESWVVHDSWLTPEEAQRLAKEFSCVSAGTYLTSFQKLVDEGVVAALLQLGEQVGAEITTMNRT